MRNIEVISLLFAIVVIMLYMLLYVVTSMLGLIVFIAGILTFTCWCAYTVWLTWRGDL